MEFLNGQIFGRPSDLLPWKLLIDGLKRLATSYRKQAATHNPFIFSAFLFYPFFSQKQNLSFLCRVFGHLTGGSTALLCRNVSCLHIGLPVQDLKTGCCPSVCRWTHQQSVLSKSLCHCDYHHSCFAAKVLTVMTAVRRYARFPSFSLSFFFLQGCGFPGPSRVSQYTLSEAHDEMRYQVNKLMVTEGGGGGG